jgi:hypothetical protein
VTDRKSRSAKRVPDPLTMRRVRWRTDVAEADLTAAFMYLTLLMDDDVAVMIVENLRGQVDTHRRQPLDLLRAADLPLLGREDPHVTAELVRVADGRKLSPVLCLRGNVRRLPVIVAGYHRICASYHCDPTADIVLKLV